MTSFIDEVAEIPGIQKTIVIPQLQYTEEKIDVNDEQDRAW